MKENPAMKKIIDNMRPGVISLHGFLGNDGRELEQIINHDKAVLGDLGISTQEAADKLQVLMEKALEGLGDYVRLNEHYSARADSIRGKLPCPFSHPGLYRKTVVTLRAEPSGREILFTALGIHLIREHSFFQGKGSPFRIEPSELPDIFKAV